MSAHHHVRAGLAGLVTALVIVAACGDDGSGQTAAPPTPPPTEAASCVEGSVTIGGIDGLRYCGPAEAELRIASSSIALTGGTCRQGDSFWTVNIGTTFPGELDPPVGNPFLGATVGDSGGGPRVGDGDFPDVFLTWTLPDGASDTASGTLRLSEGGTRAVFEGESLRGGADVIATIRC